MRKVKKHIPVIVEAIYLVFVFLFSRLPLRDYDIWFHLKSGEVFVGRRSLQFTDVFSHTAVGKEWIPYEWLFQVIVYLLSRLGMWAIPPFIGFFSVAAQFFFLRILDFIFGIKLLPRLVLSFLFFVSIYEFNTARPHVLAYSFIIVTLFLTLARVHKQKQWLWLSPLLVLVWANLHSTAFLSWGLPLAFAVFVLIQWVFKGEKNYLSVVRDLLAVSCINFLVTISPPLGTLDYKLLWTFFSKREFLGNFIAEWSPTVSILDYNPLGFYIYTISLVIIIPLFIIITTKHKLVIQNLWAVPLVIMALVGYTATRNLYLGTVGVLLLLGWCLKYVVAWPNHALRKYLWMLVAIVFVLLAGHLLRLKKQTVEHNRLYYPVQSSEFVKRYLKGKMFNDYTYGGYVLYSVYPNVKVFIDGRADVYLCCEAMQDYLLLALYKGLPDEEYKKFLDNFWAKYDISFAVLSSQKHNVLRLIARHLSSDPRWALVFWDDDSQVFVKRDGNNEEIIRQLEAKAATPYLREPFAKDQVEQAQFEYERIDKIAPSGRTSNALGYLYLLQGDYAKAKQRFLAASDQDPTFESPDMNLAELAVRNGDLETAINLYSRALKLASDRGLIYIRLGQLVLEATGDRKATKKIWEDGVKNTVDDDARTKLKELLTTL